jgi:WD40 repeat protein
MAGCNPGGETSTSFLTPTQAAIKTITATPLAIIPTETKQPTRTIQIAIPTVTDLPLSSDLNTTQIHEVYIQEVRSEPDWEGIIVGRDTNNERGAIIKLPQFDSMALPGNSPQLDPFRIYATSPDRSKIAYPDYSLDMNIDIRVIRGDNLESSMLLLPSEGGWSIIDWLDNQRLALVVDTHQDGTVFVYDTSQNEITELEPFFPTITEKGMLDLYGMMYVPYVYYDPSLTRLVIVRNLSISPPQMNYELWDTSTKTLLWEASGSLGSSAKPVWSPDGQMFAIKLDPYIPTSGDVCGSLHLIGRDGEQQQFDDCVGFSSSWSPDGRYLATWLVGRGDLCPAPYQTTELLVLEIETGVRDVYTLCSSGKGGIFVSQFPIWSPDGQFVAFNKYDVNSLPVGGIILDLAHAKAYDLAGIVEINGWIRSGP